MAHPLWVPLTSVGDGGPPSAANCSTVSTKWGWLVTNIAKRLGSCNPGRRRQQVLVDVIVLLVRIEHLEGEPLLIRRDGGSGGRGRGHIIGISIGIDDVAEDRIAVRPWHQPRTTLLPQRLRRVLLCTDSPPNEAGGLPPLWARPAK